MAGPVMSEFKTEKNMRYRLISEGKPAEKKTHVFFTSVCVPSCAYTQTGTYRQACLHNLIVFPNISGIFSSIGSTLLQSH